MEIRQYVSLLWRWAWLIVLGIVVAGGLAYVVSARTTPVYQATAVYLLDRAPSGTGNEYAQSLYEQKLAQSYVRMVNTRPVREETIARLDNADELHEGRLAGMVSISAVPETNLITIRVEDIDPTRAAAIANTMGFVFIEQNEIRENQRYAAPIANWEQRLNEEAAIIQELETQINTLSDTESPEELATLSRLETQRNEARVRYTDAFNKLNGLQVSHAQESSNLVQIESAQVNRNPIRPRTETNVLLAALVGGILAAAFIFLIDYLDDTIKSPQEVMADTGLSTLGTIAMIKGEDVADRLITSSAPRDPVSEAYRVLRTNLSFAAVDEELRTVLVTSSSPSEGKSTTAANLAVALAQTGKRVALVDADLRRPIQHKIFNTINNQGLTTAILDNNTPITFHLQKTKMPDLQVMTSGPIPPNPAELLNSHRMTQVVEELLKEVDVVVFDTPPVLTVADASILAPRMHGTLLVVESGKTRRAALMQAFERLNNANAHLFGVVINKLNPRRLGRYGYYYKYHYYYSGVKEYGRSPRRKRRSWLPGFIKR
ncbi:MAG TPA: polysaccharide biosynthesis tyrosine autokinase [Chloroflexota bacterium]|nr:polysaccharide biosynthesis tyrosine autokinase [Chloroflexota bacterium]